MYSKYSCVTQLERYIVVPFESVPWSIPVAVDVQAFAKLVKG